MRSTLTKSLTTVLLAGLTAASLNSFANNDQEAVVVAPEYPTPIILMEQGNDKICPNYPECDA